MRSDPKKRIATDSPQAPLTDLSAAFANLVIPALPEVPEVARPVQTQQQAVRKPGRVILRRERAHRGGRTVIVVHDFAADVPDSFIEETAKELRQACGCGGTVRGRTVEIQGDQVARIRAVLAAAGFDVGGER